MTVVDFPRQDYGQDYDDWFAWAECEADRQFIYTLNAHLGDNDIDAELKEDELRVSLDIDS